MGRVLRSYALEPSRGVVRLLHMCCPSLTIWVDEKLGSTSPPLAGEKESFGAFAAFLSAVL